MVVTGFVERGGGGRSIGSVQLPLKCASAGEQVEDEDDDGEDEKDVNPATQGVAANQTYDPEDEEDNGDCPKHFVGLLGDPGFVPPGSQSRSGPCGLPVVSCGAGGAGCQCE